MPYPIAVLAAALIGCSVQAATPPGGYAYVPNLHDGSVSLFALAADGGLRHLDTVPAGSAPRAAAAAGETVYVADILADSLTVFSVDGQTLRRGATLATGRSPEAVTLDPLGRFLYVANGDSDDIQLFRIGADGALSAAGRYASGDYPTAIAIDPCGRWLYVTNYAAHSVSAYAIDARSGTLTTLGSVASGNSPAAAAVSAAGDHLYVADGLGSTLSIFRIDARDGTLTALDRVAASLYPYAVVLDAAGRYLYLANFGANDVTGYTLGADGIPVATTSAAGGIGPFSITLDHAGRHAYVANVRSGDIGVYRVDPERGTLALWQMVPARPGAASVELSRAPRRTCPE